ncbi:MAG: histidine phosphatase family protein [Xanthomonadales bacterium]|nr:histidine phosphatase family protein [Xanthomonadales bacterium]
MDARQIILLRHAHAEPASHGQEDAARALSLRGEAESDAAGAWLREHGARPARVLHSGAARTRQTCERVLEVLGFTDARAEPRIYEATPATLLRVLDDHADADSLLLVGHNPGLEQLLGLLTEGSSGAGRGMPPGSIAWLELAGAVAEPGVARVRHFWWP